MEREKHIVIVMKASSSRPSPRSWLEMEVHIARRKATFSMIKLPRAQVKVEKVANTTWAATALTSTICTPSGLRFHAGGKMSSPARL